MTAEALASSWMPWLCRAPWCPVCHVGCWGSMEKRSLPFPKAQRDREVTNVIRRGMNMEAKGCKEPGRVCELPGGKVAVEGSQIQTGDWADQVVGCGRVRAQKSHCRLDAGLGAEGQGPPLLSAWSLGSAHRGLGVGNARPLPGMPVVQWAQRRQKE